jgi:hypothetical protein
MAKQTSVEGQPLPPSKQITVRLSNDDYEGLRRFAFDNRLTHQAVIERAVRNVIGRKPGRAA